MIINIPGCVGVNEVLEMRNCGSLGLNLCKGAQ